MASNKSKARVSEAAPKTTTAGIDPRAALPEHDPRKGVLPPTAESDEQLSAPRAKRVKEEPDDELVTVTVPRQFHLTDDNGKQHTYAPGIYEIPRSHASHWYSQHHGVEIKE